MKGDLIMKIINYFKKLKKERERKKVEKGLFRLCDYLDEMVAEGTMTREKALDIMSAAIWSYLEKIA